MPRRKPRKPHWTRWRLDPDSCMAAGMPSPDGIHGWDGKPLCLPAAWKHMTGKCYPICWTVTAAQLQQWHEEGPTWLRPPAMATEDPSADRTATDGGGSGHGHSDGHGHGLQGPASS